MLDKNLEKNQTFNFYCIVNGQDQKKAPRWVSRRDYRT